MEQDKMCPLVKDKCIFESCMWYVNGLSGCAVNILAQAVDCLTDTVEELTIED